MKDNMIKAYLSQADSIIGPRTPSEIEYDDVVVSGLEMGLPIEAALSNAAQRCPKEALTLTPDNKEDIAAHYDYLKEHAAILRKMGKS